MPEFDLQGAKLVSRSSGLRPHSALMVVNAAFVWGLDMWDPSRMDRTSGLTRRTWGDEGRHLFQKHTGHAKGARCQIRGHVR